MCNLDYDIADTYHQEYRISRKEHSCYECGRVINKKEKYQYTFGVWCKNVNTYKTCAHCVVGQQWLWKECGGYLHGNLRDEILEHADDYKRMDLYRFAVGMQKQWNKLSIPKIKK